MDLALSMYEKGRSFLMAGGLVKAYEGHKFVYFHLLCQGLECIGKSLLLSYDYHKYCKIIKTKFGHDLEILVAEVDRNAGGCLLSAQSLEELKLLNSYYRRHMLRYGAPEDFMKESLQINADHLHRDLVGCLTEFNERFFMDKSRP